MKFRTRQEQTGISLCSSLRCNDQTDLEFGISSIMSRSGRATIYAGYKLAIRKCKQTPHTNNRIYPGKK